MELLRSLQEVVESGRLRTFEPLLPVLLRLDRKPLTLRNHFAFAPFFACDLAKQLVLKTGRQCGKSISQGSSGITLANVVPSLKMLYIAPRFEQIRRFSTLVIKPLLDYSPMKSLWSDSTTESSVLQRSFINESKLLFSFAFLDADRTRGYQADILSIDEAQDIDAAHLPILSEVLSHSPYDITRYTGTPKTMSNLIETCWSESSQAEWCVPCSHCTTLGRPTWNIPSADHHLMDMIGPYRDDISEARPATICRNPKCRQPINPRRGRWEHRYPERRLEFAGYHVPQIIMPIHYANPAKWKKLLKKRDSYAPYLFLNEVLGESSDMGNQLVTKTDLENIATLPWRNDWLDPDAPPTEDAQRMLKAIEGCAYVALGIDWGGGRRVQGRLETSFTVLSLVGWNSTGRLSILWGKRLLHPHDHVREAREVLKWIRHLNPHFIAHDFTGAGELRETILAELQFPIERLMPIEYGGPRGRKAMVRVAPSDVMPRAFYRANRSRTLLYTIGSIKLGLTRMFTCRELTGENPDLPADFLALVDEQTDAGSSSGSYIIRREQGKSDDFAHATNLASCALWYVTDAWPEFRTALDDEELPEIELRAAQGRLSRRDWDDVDAMDGFEVYSV
jgi:hypothetical protein